MQHVAPCLRTILQQARACRLKLFFSPPSTPLSFAYYFIILLQYILLLLWHALTRARFANLNIQRVEMSVTYREAQERLQVLRDESGRQHRGDPGISMSSESTSSESCRPSYLPRQYIHRLTNYQNLGQPLLTSDSSPSLLPRRCGAAGDKMGVHPVAQPCTSAARTC